MQKPEGFVGEERKRTLKSSVKNIALTAEGNPEYHQVLGHRPP